jgi:maleamate amidohydrolase
VVFLDLSAASETIVTDESELDVYRRQGFGKPLGVKGRLGLVLVDFVRGFADPQQFGGGNIADAIRNSIPVLAFFRQHGLPVAHTRIVFADDASDANLFAAKVPGLLGLKEHAPASATVPELLPAAGELVVRKTLPSAFAGTGLSQWLVGRGVETLVIAGCTTSGCVRATALDAMSNGFRPLVLEDCVGDRALGPHQANLFDIAQKYGDVIPARDFFAQATGATAA